MKKHLLSALLLCWAPLLFAQHTFQATIQDHDANTPLIGATAYIKSLNKGAVSDENGQLSIANIPEGNYKIVLRFIGYEELVVKVQFPSPEGIEPPVYHLEHEHEHEHMEEIVISSTRSSRTIEDIPTRVEFIAGEELTEKENMKPGDIRTLLNESTGIQAQQTSATSYNSSIRIQGLDGKYTQLLRDGLPLYAGYSGGLSLMQVAPLDLKQVEVIKGASSTLYGGGAIAGLVNLITKIPEEERTLNFMLNGTSALGLDASGFYAEKFGKIGVTLFSSYNIGSPYDPSDTGLTAIPKFNRFTLNPRLFFYLNEQTTVNAGVNIVAEDRLGGNLEYIKGNEVTDPYFEQNLTDRMSTQFQLTHNMEHGKLLIKNSFNFFERRINIPDFSFGGQQTSSFSELSYLHLSSSSEWVLGANLWTDQFEQTLGSDGDPLDFEQHTLSTFIQNTWNVAPKWTVETGFRLDYQNEYGVFPLPRMSLLFEPTEAVTLRVGGGLGYKIPTVFSEDAERLHFRNILPIDPTQMEAERSAGSNLDINYKVSITDELTLSTNALFFYTQINNPLLLRSVGNAYTFQQPQGYIDTQGMEMNMKWSYHHFKLFMGYTFADVHQHYEGTTTTMPLVAKHRLNNVLMYERHGNFWVGLEGYYYSPQELSDGTIGQSYWIVGLMTEKKIGEHFSVFLNFENFLDTRQTAFDTIYTGSLSDPQFRDIYAPVDGFVMNGGLKWAL
ncbi:TonB-dependent receptor [Algivirga pacifica]|uniref:Iron complex outermembrane recepter protein n=1 Tax=Algivirga pacifica TaxID=1162670 RepID=A0ABP9DLU2_9BACT